MELGKDRFPPEVMLAEAEAFGRERKKGKMWQVDCMKWILQGGTAKDGVYQTDIRAKNDLKQMARREWLGAMLGPRLRE